ncbi:2OG-Fe(II) oxygenase [Pseudomonas sp. dw_358]|uniref:2OG-Fe(II) oxygenase n=1 Tax=Pseudomonas sp. dw_358 TaxID=2720083 RepID=UPI001BD3FF60|nr:2OG-Fe(II) oxygenase [Pseudomonas sp. dw_358]
MTANAIASLIADSLEKAAPDIVQQWTASNGDHTRYFVVDDLLPSHLAHSIYQAFPSKAEGFHQRQSFRERKKTLTDLSKSSAILGQVTYAFQDPAVVGKIADLVAIEGIAPDASLYAGGLSMMCQGDFLNPHIDNSHDGARKLYRRLNLLYYVSPGWADEHGGSLELWNPDVSQGKAIAPLFNRLVVMETNKTSWHSVSAITGSEPRCCVSNYYFSQQSPHGDEYFHVTSFSGRPEQPGLRMLGVVDNQVRNLVSRALRIGRGTRLVNTPKP